MSTPLSEDFEYWSSWDKRACEREPIFLQAIDHHEHELNYPGVDIIVRTEPESA